MGSVIAAWRGIEVIGYQLATISVKIRRVEYASFDGKTILPNWNS
jgi:hypothetical protein